MLTKLGLTALVTCICAVPFLLSWALLGVDSFVAYCGFIGGGWIWFDCLSSIWGSDHYGLYDDDGTPYVGRTDSRRGKGGTQ